jgi:hypothetical protein
VGATVKSFSRDIQTSKPPDTVRREALTSLTRPLGGYGYVLTTESESGLTFARQYRPWWVWVLAVVIFPIGVLLMFDPNIATVTVFLEPHESGTLVRVAGLGERKVGQAFESMEL